MTPEQRQTVFKEYALRDNFVLPGRMATTTAQPREFEGAEEWVTFCRLWVDRAEKLCIEAFDNELEPLMNTLGYKSALDLYDADGVCAGAELPSP